MSKAGDETEYSVFGKPYKKDKYPFLFDHEVIDFSKNDIQMRVGNGMALSSSKGLLEDSPDNDPRIMKFVGVSGEEFTKMWYAGVKRIISLHTGNEACCDDREDFTLQTLVKEGKEIKDNKWKVKNKKKLINMDDSKKRQECLNKIRKFAELLLKKIKREHLSDVDNFDADKKYRELVDLTSWKKEEEAIMGGTDRENKLYQAFFFSDIWYAQFAGGFKIGDNPNNIYKKLFHFGRRTGDELVYTSSLKPTPPSTKDVKSEKSIRGRKLKDAPESSKNQEAKNATNLAFEIVENAIPEGGILFLCEAPKFDKGNSIFNVDTVGEPTEAFCAIWKNKEIKVVGELIKNEVEDELKKNEGFPDVALFQVYKKTPEGEDEDKNNLELLYKVIVCHFDSSNLMKKEEFQRFRSKILEYSPAFIVGDSNITIKKILKKCKKDKEVKVKLPDGEYSNEDLKMPPLGHLDCIGNFIGITKEQLKESKKIEPEPDIRKYWYLDIENKDLENITLSTKKIKKVRIKNNGFLNNQVSKGGDEEIDVDGMFVLKMNPEQSPSGSSPLSMVAAAKTAAAVKTASSIIKATSEKEQLGELKDYLMKILNDTTPKEEGEDEEKKAIGTAYEKLKENLKGKLDELRVGANINREPGVYEVKEIEDFFNQKSVNWDNRSLGEGFIIPFLEWQKDKNEIDVVRGLNEFISKAYNLNENKQVKLEHLQTNYPDYISVIQRRDNPHYYKILQDFKGTQFIFTPKTSETSPVTGDGNIYIFFPDNAKTFQDMTQDAAGREIDNATLRAATGAHTVTDIFSKRQLMEVMPPIHFVETFTKENPSQGGAIMKSKKRSKSNKRKTKKSSKKRGKSKKSRKKSRKRR